MPILDTLGVSLESVVPASLAALLSLNCNVGNDFAYGPWEIRAGRLNGYSAYTHVATGTGEWEGVQVSIGPPRSMSEVPNARALRLDVGSEVCWRHAVGGGGAYSVAAMTLRGLLDTGIIMSIPADNAVSVRRLDVCVDHWGHRWEIADLDRFACRQKGRGASRSEVTAPKDSWVYKAAQGFTLYLGKRGAAARFMRIYDKVAEAAKSGKLPWLMPLWSQAGWDGESTVWRAEVEHGGEWLRQHGLETMDKLPGCERELWRDYTTDVRHVIPETDTRLKRCDASRVWRSLAVAARLRSHGVWRWQPRPPSGDADATTLLKMATGCLRGAAKALRPCFLTPGDGSAPWDASKATDAHVHSAMYGMVETLWDAADAREAAKCPLVSEGQAVPLDVPAAGDVKEMEPL